MSLSRTPDENRARFGFPGVRSSSPEIGLATMVRPISVAMTYRENSCVWTLRACAGAIGIVAQLVLANTAVAGSFRGLGAPPGYSPEQVEVYDISDDGTIVVGLLRDHDPFEEEAFRWSEATGYVRLGNLGGVRPESVAIGVSPDGAVVVGSSTSPESDPYGQGFDESMRWTQSSGMVGLGDLEGGLFHGIASAASADGSVIVGRSSSTLGSSSIGEAFRWTEATGMVGLGIAAQGGSAHLGFVFSYARGVSADGTVVAGTTSTDTGREAFRWTEEGGMALLGDLPGNDFPDSWAGDISADGAVIVGFSGLGGFLTRAFRWTTNSGMVELGALPGSDFTRAWSVSADGSVVVGDSYVGSESLAFVWDETHGIRELREAMVEAGLSQEIEGWDFELAAAVAADNLTILGRGRNPSGHREAFLVHLVPPSVVEIPAASPEALVAFASLLMAAAFKLLRLR